MNEPFQRHQLQARETSAEAGRQHSAEETQHGELTFQTPEELLRHDAATIAVPEGIASRLADTAPGTEAVPWWRRLFGGS